jgi:hypothetical protein
MIELLTLAGTATGLGMGAGVNAYATMLVFGVVSRFYPHIFTGDLASFFASTPVLATVGVLYAIEFFADKIPALDHVWDAVHTFIRPLAGGLVAFSAANPEIPQGAVILASLIGGGAALSTHAAKATFRASSTVATGGVANPFISLVEDLFAVVQAVVAIFLPLVVLVLAFILFAGFAIFFGRRRARRAA